MKWTKGPWSWGKQTYDDHESEYVLRPGVLLTDLTDGTPWGDEHDRANASLIAAAPDLYAACEAALDALDGLANNVDTNPWCQELRAAIAKAKGEAA